MVYTSIYREHKPICLTIGCYVSARKYELYHVEHNEIIRKTNKNKGNFCQPKQISNELCWQNVGNFIKVKILTAYYQAVRIFSGAPDRHILIITNEIL